MGENEKQDKISIPISNEELVKRTAAGMANATKGRSRVFKNKKKYDRKGNKNESDVDGEN